MANRNNHLRNVVKARLELRNDDRRYKLQIADGVLEKILLRRVHRVLAQGRGPDSAALQDCL